MFKLKKLLGLLGVTLYLGYVLLGTDVHAKGRTAHAGDLITCQFYAAYAQMLERTERIYSEVEKTYEYGRMTPYEISMLVTLADRKAYIEIRRTMDERNVSVRLAAKYLYDINRCNTY